MKFGSGESVTISSEVVARIIVESFGCVMKKDVEIIMAENVGEDGEWFIEFGDVKEKSA